MFKFSHNGSIAAPRIKREIEVDQFIFPIWRIKQTEPQKQTRHHKNEKEDAMEQNPDTNNQ